MRSFLYALARAMGDYNAIKRGRVGERIQRRILGRLASRVINKAVRPPKKEV